MPNVNRRNLLIILIVAAGALLIGGIAFGMRTESHDFSGDALLTSNRDKLRICVDTIDASQPDATVAIEQIEEAFPDVMTHPKFAEWGYAKGGEVVIDSGCPGEPFMLQPGIEYENGKPNNEPVAPEVEKPSVYRLFVYVVSEEIRDRVIKGDLDIGSLPQEAVCEDYTCFVVTRAIYLTKAEFSEKDFLTEWLVRGLELEPPKGYTPDDFKPGDPR